MDEIRFSKAQFVAGGVILVLAAGAIGFGLGRSFGGQFAIAPGGVTPPPAAGTPSAEVPTPTSSSGSSAGPKAVVFPGANSIAVNDQPPAQFVSIQLLSLTQSAWIAIHEDVDGKPGNILGAARFQKGTPGGVVELLRPTVEGGVYYAMIHSDDGDAVFDHTKDLPAADGQGNIMMVRFVATERPGVAR